MSHFSVIVIGPDIEAQLQPYHEFECTGEDDQYVVDVDITEQLRNDYETGTCTRFVTPSGEQVGWEAADDVREASTRIEVPHRDVVSFSEYIDDERGELPRLTDAQLGARPETAKYGYVRVGEQGEILAVVRRTNPNARWDYWRVGGRWRGLLRVKSGTSGLLSDEPWESGFARRQGQIVEDPEGVDQCLRQNLDVAGAKQAARVKAEATFDRWERLVAEHGKAETWSTIRDRAKSIDAARNEYNAQSLVKQANKDQGGMGHRFGCWVEEMGYDRAAYIKAKEIAALVPYAVVKDGKWFARGEMGWFGISIGETDYTAWCEQFHRMIDDLPPDTLLTVVDCHI